MKLTTRLAHSHLKSNRRQTAFTLTAATLATSMLAGLCGISYSFFEAFARYAEATGRGTESLSQLWLSLFPACALLGAIIVFGAVLVISNAFAISAGERVRQFGILKSAGATSRQIRETVMSEGVLLSIIAIPAGVLAGFLVTAIGVEILAHYIDADMINDGGREAAFVFKAVFDLPTALLAAAVSLLTVLFSAYRVARRAGSLSAMDAIGQSGEVVVRAKDVRTGKIAGKLFGFEGTLAAKSMGRSRRKYRATVVSLVVSVVLALAGAGFGQLLYAAANDVQAKIPYNALVYASGEDFGAVQELLEAYGGVEVTARLYKDEAEDYVYFFCQADDPAEFCEYAERALAGFVSDIDHYAVNNNEAQQRQANQLYTMLMIFIYCFVGMLTLVGAAGVIATIDSNLALRAPEFAMLASVGMDARGLSRMLNLESLMYGLKSLAIGLPLGLLACYGMRFLATEKFSFGQPPPLLAIALCAAGVFAITFISMGFASAKLRRSSIIDTIRGSAA